MCNPLRCFRRKEKEEDKIKAREKAGRKEGEGILSETE